MQEKIDNTKILRIISKRFYFQGLSRVEISRLIKDVFNLLRDRGNLTVTSVNEELERLGWKENIMNEDTFALITFLFENEYEYNVERHSLQ